MEFQKIKGEYYLKFIATNYYHSLKGVKPKYCHCYCDCKCVEIDESGYGLMRLCQLHIDKSRHKVNGDLLVPQVRVEIPYTIKEKIKFEIKSLLSPLHSLWRNTNAV